MDNLLLNKPATANNSYAPFLPSRAVDGVNTPASRWISSISPAWLSVDMGNNYYVNRYCLTFMGALGWQPAQNYNVKNYVIQGSLNGSSWNDLDNMYNNTANTVDRYLPPQLVRYLRIYIPAGLPCNKDIASVADFQAYEMANAPFLSNLVPSTGTLNPAFNSRYLSYSISVANDVGSIAFTPSAEQTNMEIRVNNQVVISGNQSQQINLVVGNNTIPVTVKSADGAVTTTYTIYVTRAAGASYLNSLVVKNNRNQDVPLVPSFVKEILNYTASQGSGTASVTVTPTAVDPLATIFVNGTSVPSGTTSAPITLQTGQNSIQIVVNSTTTYTIVITKG